MAGRKKNFNEEEAIAKALDIFWLHGFEGTGTRDLAQAMNINYGSVYHTFKSKESLYLRALEYGAPKMFSHFEKMIYDSKNPLLGLRKLFEDLIAERDPLKIMQGCFVGNTLMEFVDQSSEIRFAAQKKFKQFEKMFLKALKKAQADSYLPEHKDCETLAAHLLNLYQGLMINRRNDPSTKKLRQLIDLNFQMLEG